MNVNRVFIVLLLVVIGILAVEIFVNSRNNLTIKTVNLEMVFDSFQMKLEIQSKYQNIESMREKHLESIKVELMALQRQLENKRTDDKVKMELEAKAIEYKRKEAEFEESNGALTEQYNSQIWTRLNQYVKDYSKDKGIDVMLGVNETGNVMYSIKKVDETGEVIKYVNKKYMGE